MRLLSTEVRGLLAIKEARIDYTELGQVVAFVGANGNGKSGLIEAPLAALYRRMASRTKNLADMCKGRDAYVEAVFGDDDGTEWRARISIDAEKRKVEQHLLRNGKPVTTGRAAEVEKAVREHFGSLDALLASVFCAQDRAGEFSSLGKAERKALMVEALGLNKLQERCEAARGHAAAFGAQADVLLVRSQEIEAKKDALSLAERSLEQATASGLEWTEIQAMQQQEVTEAQAALADLRVKAEAAVGATAALERARRAQMDASARSDRAAQARKRVEEEVAQRTKRLQYRRDNLQAKAAPVDGAALVDLGPLELDRDVATRALLNAETALEACRKDYEEARLAQQRASGAAKLAESKDEAETQRRQGLATQAELLHRVPCTDEESWVPSYGGDGVPLAGTCPLLSAARGAEAELQKRPPDPGIEAAQLAFDAATQRLASLTEQGLQAKATHATALAAHRTTLAALEQAVALNRDAGDKLRAQREAEQALAALDQEEQAALASDCEALDHASADRVQAARDLEAAEVELRAASEQASGKAVPEDALARAAARATEAATKLKDAADELRKAERAQAAEEATAGRLRADLAACAHIAEQLRDAQDAQQDWQILADALGRDGIQALEIDAAGPGIAELCNELLASCYGPRFSLRFETLRQNKSNDGAQEVFDIVALDNGTERLLEDLSGGEKVIVREALALALAIWNARRSGVRWRTIFRDETSGALSQFNQLAYVTMLRKACDLGGFAQVVFVSHQPEVSARADSLVLVEDGTARVA